MFRFLFVYQLSFLFRGEIKKSTYQSVLNIPYITTIGGSLPICMWYLKRSTISNCCFILFFFSMIPYSRRISHVCRNFTANKLYRSNNTYLWIYFVCFELEIFLAFRINPSSRKGICWSNLPRYKWEIKAVDIFIFKAIRLYVELLCPHHIHIHNSISVHKLGIKFK